MPAARILVCQLGSSWHTWQQALCQRQYNVFSMPAYIGVNCIATYNPDNSDATQLAAKQRHPHGQSLLCQAPAALSLMVHWQHLQAHSDIADVHIICIQVHNVKSQHIYAPIQLIGSQMISAQPCDSMQCTGNCASHTRSIAHEWEECLSTPAGISTEYNSIHIPIPYQEMEQQQKLMEGGQVNISSRVECKSGHCLTF